MTKKDLIAKMETVYGDMECFETDETLFTMGKAFKAIREKFSDLIGEIEEEGIIEEVNE